MGLGTGDANAERQNGSEMSRQMAPSADCTAVMTAQLTRAQFAAPAADVSQSGIVVAIALEIVYRMFMETNRIDPAEPLIVSEQRSGRREMVTCTILVPKTEVVESQIDLRIHVPFGEVHFSGNEAAFKIQAQRLLNIEHLAVQPR